MSPQAAADQTGDIEFVRYHSPHGRKSIETIRRPAEVAEKGMLIRRAGYRFECEVLWDGTVSLTIADEEADHAIELVPNGASVPAAVDKLILGFKVPKRRLALSSTEGR